MATPQYAAGYPAGVQFAPTSTGIYTAVNIVGWDSALKCDSLDTSSSGSGGVEERIAGLLRGQFTFNATFDLANYYFNTAPGITVATKGTLRQYVSVAKFFQWPVMVLEEPVKSTVAGKVEFTITAGLDSSSGAIVRPV